MPRWPRCCPDLELPQHVKAKSIPIHIVSFAKLGWCSWLCNPRHSSTISGGCILHYTSFHVLFFNIFSIAYSSCGQAAVSGECERLRPSWLKIRVGRPRTLLYLSAYWYAVGDLRFVHDFQWFPGLFEQLGRLTWTPFQDAVAFASHLQSWQ